MSRILEVVRDTAVVRIASAGPILVVQFRSAVTADALRAIEKAQDLLLARHPAGTLLLTIVDGSVPVPAEDARPMVAETFRKMAARNLAAATVIRGGGFWASAIRSTLTALALVVKPPCPQKTFADVNEALTWLLSFDARTSLDARTMNLAIDRLCAHP